MGIKKMSFTHKHGLNFDSQTQIYLGHIV